MSNVVQSSPGKVVQDPFCGTGGLLVSSAHNLAGGGMVLGCDLDGRVLKGWRISYVKNKEMNKKVGKIRGEETKEKKDIIQNFYQYGLKRPDLVNCDMSVSCWRGAAEGWLDGIITDPPYGIRAASRNT